jgi:hypothetical protein
MQKITNLASLINSIELLEEKNRHEEIMLKQNIQYLLYNLQPATIIKNTLQDITSSSEIKSSIVDIVLGITSGALAKKILVGETHNPISSITGTLVEMIVAKNITQNADKIKTFGLNIIHKFLNRAN